MVPVNVGGGVGSAGWTAISAGDYHSCGVRAGVALCWGLNSSGQLGDGTNGASLVPVNVGGGGGTPGWTAIFAGLGHSCGVRAGVALCWGNNSAGQLGDGTNTPSLVPVNVGGGGPLGWTAISAGDSHSCGVRAGVALCWGYGGDGRLGVGNTTASLVPVNVGGGGGSAGWTAISASGLYSCGVRAGVALCWGDNYSGRLGDGTNTASLTPVNVSGPLGWTAISAGQGHSCGVRAGVARCWGYNNSGQLGDGSNTASLVPVNVA